jgi:metal-responsive CopG/Arc/MetJ family transcriptional regulator
MKTLTIELPEDVYERAERRAADRGSSLRREAVEWLERYSGTVDD